MGHPLASTATSSLGSQDSSTAQLPQPGPSTSTIRSIHRTLAPSPLALTDHPQDSGRARARARVYPQGIPSHPPSSPHRSQDFTASSIASSSRPSAVAEYVVSTATTSISDLRIQVCLPVPESSAASASKVERPIWFKERTLSSELDSTLGDEIVDNLIDANSGRVKWSTARPVRGWYLHLRSPSLPPKTAIPLRASRVLSRADAAAIDVSATPLEVVIGSRIDRQALRRCSCHIPAHARPLHPSRTSHSRHDSAADFEDVPLSKLEASPRKFPTHISTSGLDASGARHSTSTSLDLGVSRISSQFHVRKRSAGGASGSADSSVGTASEQSARDLGSRNPSASKAPKDVDMVPEEAEDGDWGHRARQDGPKSAKTLLRPPSSNGLTNHDRPYEPALPKVLSPLQANGNSLLHVNTPELDGEGKDIQPTRCTFVLLDGTGASAEGWQSIFGAADLKSDSRRSSADSLSPKRQSGSSSWARWAWNMIPAQVRPSLALDSCKSFTVRWIDVPQHTSSTTAAGEMEARTDRTGVRLANAVEMLRFEDLTPAWLGAKTRGRLRLQMDAVKAVGLEVDFWIQVALSYLEFLEERDGYHAAYDG
ncbi:hypothetical protein IE81DRAFT_369104 [Ceraceosorus guamensis]|uniref:Uncharacterized protein n=1 Tax=Ceraceosorus guamensis TaxID=1522189 RepID=A0A316VQU6_9BASI|nr:hypothetical protein IE81DRAFT_369104 [Ceraceosorus guamensis]PWN39428.1 hypothetical protein IE81DRAFT_369104 [Ceraceosorus guamensis]